MDAHHVPGMLPVAAAPWVPAQLFQALEALCPCATSTLDQPNQHHIPMGPGESRDAASTRCRSSSCLGPCADGGCSNTTGGGWMLTRQP